MEVALVCNSTFGTDGISLFVLNNHSCFMHDGVRFHLIYSSIHSPKNVVENYVREFEKDGDKAVFIPKGDGLVNYAKKLYSYFKKEKIDVLHVHGSSSAILVELVIAKLAGLKKIVTHSHNTRSNHNFIHKVLRPAVNLLADEKMACGELAGKWMYGKYGRFTIIPNCIDTVRYIFDENVRREVRQNLGIDDNTIVIGHVGMFTEVKNQKFLLQVLAEINKKKEDNYKLLLIGHGPLLQDVMNVSEQLRVSNNVLFMGNRNDVPRIMMAMDVFCLPSLFEGFPIVAVEAQATGLPVIISSNISKETIITDTVMCLPIDNGTEMWERAIGEMVNVHVDRAVYADKVKEAGYDISCSAEMLESVYYTI